MAKKILPQKRVIQKESHWIDAYSSLTVEQVEALAFRMKAEGILTVELDGYESVGYDDDTRIQVTETRYETDEEFNKRIKEEADLADKIKQTKKKDKLAKQALELETLNRLLKKYKKTSKLNVG